MKKTALYNNHLKLGAKMVNFAGFEMPVSYSGIKDEHLAVRNDVGLFDVSHMGEFLVKGEDATALLQWICTNDVSKVEDMQCQYTCMTNDKGGIVDDLLIYKWSDTEYNLIVNAANIDKDFDWIAKQMDEKGFDVELQDMSADLSLIAVQGPKALDLVQELTDLDLKQLAYYRFEAINLAGVGDVIISNTGYTGSGGFEIYVWNDDAAKIWEALLEKGTAYNAKPCGLASRDTLRLEKGFCLYGNDIDDSTSPIEAGLGWITKFNHDFVNKDYHLALKENGVAQKLVGFELKDKGIPRKDYEVVAETEQLIGRVTSGTQSPSLNKAIGLAYVNKEFAKAGTSIYIKNRKKLLKATVVRLPFLK